MAGRSKQNFDPRTGAIVKDNIFQKEQGSPSLLKYQWTAASSACKTKHSFKEHNLFLIKSALVRHQYFKVNDSESQKEKVELLLNTKVVPSPLSTGQC